MQIPSERPFSSPALSRPGVSEQPPAQSLPALAQPEAPQETLALQPQPSQAQTELNFVTQSDPIVLHLSSEQTQKLLELIQGFPELQAELETLARSGPGAEPILLAKDFQGHSILDHLHRLATGKSKNPEIDPKTVLRELVPRLADRNRVFQGPQFTCASAALQNWMHKACPGDLAKIMTDLSLNGSSKLQDKSRLRLPPGLDSYLKNRPQQRFNQGQDTDQRALCDLLFQSAVMQDVSLVGGNRNWKGDQGLIAKGLGWLSDWQGYDVQEDDIGLGSRLKGDGGGNPKLLMRLMEGISGQNAELNTLLNQDSLRSALEQIKQNGQELIALYKKPLHYVLVKDYDPLSATVSCLSTGTYGSKQESFSLEDFLKNCAALIG